MLRPACGFLIGSVTLATLPTSLFIQGGALAILGWAMWYLLARAIPSILKSAREERALFLKAQKEDRQVFKDSLTLLANEVNTLTAALIKKG